MVKIGPINIFKGCLHEFRIVFISKIGCNFFIWLSGSINDFKLCYFCTGFDVFESPDEFKICFENAKHVQKQHDILSIGRTCHDSVNIQSNIEI